MYIYVYIHKFFTTQPLSYGPSFLRHIYIFLCLSLSLSIYIYMDFLGLCVFACFWRNTYTRRCLSTLGPFQFPVKQISWHVTDDSNPVLWGVPSFRFSFGNSIVCLGLSEDGRGSGNRCERHQAPHGGRAPSRFGRPQATRRGQITQSKST